MTINKLMYQIHTNLRLDDDGYLSKEDDTLEFIWEGEVKIQYSKGAKQSDHAYPKEQNNPFSTTIVAAVAKVKGCPVSRETVPTQFACTCISMSGISTHQSRQCDLTFPPFSTLLIWSIILEETTRQCTKTSAVEEAR